MRVCAFIGHRTVKEIEKLTYKYRSSGTKWAYEYAKRKNKKLINVIEP